MNLTPAEHLASLRARRKRVSAAALFWGRKARSRLAHARTLAALHALDTELFLQIYNVIVDDVKVRGVRYNAPKESPPPEPSPARVGRRIRRQRLLSR